MNGKLVSFSLILLFLAACASPKAAVQNEVTVTLGLPEQSRVSFIDGSEAPTIFSFLLGSDLVAIASTHEALPVGSKVRRSPPDSGDWFKGAVNSFQIEELLFDKDAFLASEPLGSSTIRTFEVFRIRDLKVVFLKYQRYLLFLKRISKEDEIFRKLDLDPGKTYYRVYEGNTTLFPVSGPWGHGTYNVGMIDLSTGRHSELLETIKQLCEALSPGNNPERIANLKRFTKSNNKMVRENAEYAIGYLESLNGVKLDQ